MLQILVEPSWKGFKSCVCRTKKGDVVFVKNNYKNESLVNVNRLILHGLLLSISLKTAIGIFQIATNKKRNCHSNIFSKT